MRKTFVTPCWLMLLPAVMIVYGLYRVSHLGALGLMVRPRRLVVPWLWFALVVIDAGLYWSIRKTNIYRRNSLILGHALFIRLLLKSSSRRSDGPPEEADPRNLLDDVLTGS